MKYLATIKMIFTKTFNDKRLTKYIVKKNNTY